MQGGSTTRTRAHAQSAIMHGTHANGMNTHTHADTDTDTRIHRYRHRHTETHHATDRAVPPLRLLRRDRSAPSMMLARLARVVATRAPAGRTQSHRTVASAADVARECSPNAVPAAAVHCQQRASSARRALPLPLPPLPPRCCCYCYRQTIVAYVATRAETRVQACRCRHRHQHQHHYHEATRATMYDSAYCIATRFTSASNVCIVVDVVVAAQLSPTTGVLPPALLLPPVTVDAVPTPIAAGAADVLRRIVIASRLAERIYDIERGCSVCCVCCVHGATTNRANRAQHYCCRR